MNMKNIIPKEITVDTDNGLQIASFGYYDGIKYCDNKGIKQTNNFDLVAGGDAFMVCCGDVMVKVVESDYPEIERRFI